jgi:hypothetical protein
MTAGEKIQGQPTAEHGPDQPKTALPDRDRIQRMRQVILGRQPLGDIVL